MWLPAHRGIPSSMIQILLFIFSIHANADQIGCEYYLNPKFPFVRQEQAYTCGVACVRSFMWRATGKLYSEKYLANALGTTTLKATYTEQIQTFLSTHGYETQVLANQTAANLFTFLKYNHTLFIPWNETGPHWSLLVAANAYGVTLMDPWIANSTYRFIPWFQFMRAWYDGGLHQGHALLIRPR